MTDGSEDCAMRHCPFQLSDKIDARGHQDNEKRGYGRKQQEFGHTSVGVATVEVQDNENNITIPATGDKDAGGEMGPRPTYSQGRVPWPPASRQASRWSNRS